MHQIRANVLGKLEKSTSTLCEFKGRCRKPFERKTSVDKT